jgi:hypothetical protein
MDYGGQYRFNQCHFKGNINCNPESIFALLNKLSKEYIFERSTNKLIIYIYYYKLSIFIEQL